MMSSTRAGASEEARRQSADAVLAVARRHPPRDQGHRHDRGPIAVVAPTAAAESNGVRERAATASSRSARATGCADCQKHWRVLRSPQRCATRASTMATWKAAGALAVLAAAATVGWVAAVPEDGTNANWIIQTYDVKRDTCKEVTVGDRCSTMSIATVTVTGVCTLGSCDSFTYALKVNGAGGFGPYESSKGKYVGHGGTIEESPPRPPATFCVARTHCLRARSPSSTTSTACACRRSCPRQARRLRRRRRRRPRRRRPRRRARPCGR